MNKFYLLLLSSLLTLTLNAQTNLGNHESYFSKLRKNASSKTNQTKEVKVSPDEAIEVLIYKSTENLITGGIEGVEESMFMLNHNSNETSGFLIKNKKTAYSISTNSDGNITVEETQMDDLMCVGYTSDSNEETPSIESISNKFEYAWDPFDLNSNPGESAVVFLDFDGYNLPAGTAWNSGNAMFAAPPVGWTDMDMLVAWNILKEDLAPFKVNVTTNEDVFNAAAVGNRTRALFTSSMPNQGIPSNVVGVAINGSFKFNWDSPCWVFTSKANVMSSSHTASHEVGHGFSLKHDGKGTTTYYRGHNDWSPIMGSSSGGNLSQWSKGDYSGATEPNQDDVQIIANMVGGFKTDVIGNDKNSAEEIVYTIDNQGIAVVEKNDGLIETRSDVDVWHFYLAGGTVNLDIIPRSLPRTNLDLEVELYDANDNLITTVGTGHQNFTDGVNLTRVLAAGDYYIHVDGVGTGTGPTVGWTDYDCMGYYRIEGTIEGIEQKNYDVALVEIANVFANDCGSSISPEIEILNGGKLNLQSVNIQLLLDNVSIYNQVSSISVPSGASSTVSVGSFPINSFGNKTLKVVLSSPNGQVDEIPSNNNGELNFTIGAGQLYEFSISTASMEPNMDWRIQNGQTTIISNNQVSASSSGGLRVQQFCIANGCYDIVVTDAFLQDLCNQYLAWNSATQYAAGDKFVYQGRVYEANTAIWGVDPIGWAQYFNDLGPCPSPTATDYYSFKNLHTGDVIVSEQVASYTSPGTKAFCGEDVVGVVTVNFTANKTNANHCENVTFTAQTSGTITSYAWDFGVNASPSTAIGVGPHTVKYLADGNKSVSLTVNGTETALKSNYIVVNVDQSLLPSVSIGLNGNPQCEGENVGFVINEINEGNTAQYEWFVNNQSVSNSRDYTIINSSDGSTVVLELTSSDECAISNVVFSNELILSLDAMITPSISIKATDLNPCENDEVTVSIDLQGGEGTNPVYDWFVNDVKQWTGLSFVSKTLSGSNQIKLKMTSSAACASVNTVTSNELSVVVKNQVVPSITISSSLMPVCENTAIDFTSNVNPNNTVTWYVNGSFESTGESTSISTLSNNDIVTAGVLSTENCSIDTEVISNTITAQIDVCTGLSDSDDIQLSIYPNPVNNELIIQTEGIIEHFSILNISGLEVMKGALSSSSDKINLQELEAGFYLIKMQMNNEVITRSIIKK